MKNTDLIKQAIAEGVKTVSEYARWVRANG